MEDLGSAITVRQRGQEWRLHFDDEENMHTFLALTKQ